MPSTSEIDRQIDAFVERLTSPRYEQSAVRRHRVLGRFAGETEWHLLALGETKAEASRLARENMQMNWSQGCLDDEQPRRVVQTMYQIFTDRWR